MSQKELAREAVLEKINRKELTMKAGAESLGISIRHLKSIENALSRNQLHLFPFLNGSEEDAL